MSLLPRTPDWMGAAVCSQTDPEAFFPEGPRETSRAAKAVCAGCPVLDACLEYALDNVDLDGVWGGTTKRERAKIRAERGIAKPIHGTRAGYLRHRENGDEACASCVKGNRAYHARRAAIRRAAA